MRTSLFKKLLLTFFIASTLVVQSNVTVYSDQQSRFAQSPFQTTLDGQKVVAEKFRNIHYIHYSCSGSTTVCIVYRKPIKSYEISPLSKAIKGKVEGNHLTFQTPGTGFVVVRINGGEYLFLLSDPEEKDVPTLKSSGVLNLAAYVKDNKGKTLQTENLQRALNDASTNKKILFVPPGIYLTGTLRIKSNTRLYLAPGALIQGSADRKDYPTDGNRLEADHVNLPKDQWSDNGEFMTFSRLLLIDKAENVHIFGRGTIDGNGTKVRTQGRPANLIRIRNSKNVLIEDVVLRNPAAWNTHIHYSENVTVRNVKIINDADNYNTDGIDPDASLNTLVDHVFMYCNDDNIAIKTTNNLNLNRDLDGVIVRNCVFLTRKSSLKVGTETKGSVMKNILFENNDVISSDRGIVLYLNDGALFTNITFVNNRFEYAYVKGQQRGIHIVIRNRYGKGTIDGVLIKDNVFYRPFPQPSEILGLDVDAEVKNVVIENLVIGGTKINSLKEGNININEFTKSIQVR